MYLPENYETYVDKYFLRALKILIAEDLNPFARAQVFIRRGPGIMDGMTLASSVFEKYFPLKENGGHLYVLEDGKDFSSCETLMIVEGRIQDFISLETMPLGILSKMVSRRNSNIRINLGEITRNMERIVKAAKGKPVYYGGARHWGFDEDYAISKAAFEGGVSGCSTDMGASSVNRGGMGTIPHSLENIFAWIYGTSNAVVETALAFDRHIDPSVPRMALIDYANKEVDDSLKCASELGSKLYGVRVDTCGENISQYAMPILGVFSHVPEDDKQYWFGKGVTVHGVHAIRRALNKDIHNHVNIMVSSGFGNEEKVNAFTRSEDILQEGFFNSILVGGIYDSWVATMDIVGVGEDLDHLKPFGKTGRVYRPNPQLTKIF